MTKKPVGRPPRTDTKSKPIWCGQLTEAERAAILKLTPAQRKKALLAATNH